MKLQGTKSSGDVKNEGCDLCAITSNYKRSVNEHGEDQIVYEGKRKVKEVCSFVGMTRLWTIRGLRYT